MALDYANSTLTTFLKYNQKHTDGRHLLYQDFLKYLQYWNKKGKWQWTPRKRCFNIIGRIYHCNPFASERYYLWLFLTVLCGSPSFKNIQTVDGNLHLPYWFTYMALGLLEDDKK